MIGFTLAAATRTGENKMLKESVQMRAGYHPRVHEDLGTRDGNGWWPPARKTTAAAEQNVTRGNAEKLLGSTTIASSQPIRAMRGIVALAT